jgi:replicative DNA helicase
MPAAATVIDRLPPHSPEAEQGVLGCMLIDPNECIPQCIETLKSGIEEFYDLRHQTIYNMLLEMFDVREEVGLITLMQNLKDRQMLDQVGGISYLSGLIETVASSAQLPSMLEIVHEKYILRLVVRECTDVVSDVMEFEGDVDEKLDDIERRLLKISEQRVTGSTPTIREITRSAMEGIQNLYENKGKLTGVATGFYDLDRYTNGLQGGDMIIIAGRPSLGKTSLAMNFVEYMVLDLSLPVGVFSLEMLAQALVTRMITSRSGVSLNSLRDQIVSDDQWRDMTKAAGDIIGSKLYIDDSSDMSVMQARSKARRWKQQYDIKALVIDYLQLMNAMHSKRAHEGREAEIAEIAQGIKGLAKELEIPVIVLCQLNREIDKEKTRKPRLSDLRGSGSIEQAGDLIGILYAPGSEDNPDNDGASSRRVNLWIGKQRNGIANIDVPLTFFPTITRFRSASRVSDEDAPEPRREQQSRLPYNQ